MNKIYNRPPSILLKDKREYCLSSLSIKDNNVRQLVYTCDFLYETIDNIYDSIIFNRGVISDEITHYLKELTDYLKKAEENLNE